MLARMPPAIASVLSRAAPAPKCRPLIEPGARPCVRLFVSGSAAGARQRASQLLTRKRDRAQPPRRDVPVGQAGALLRFNTKN